MSDKNIIRGGDKVYLGKENAKKLGEDGKATITEVVKIEADD